MGRLTALRMSRPCLHRVDCAVAWMLWALWSRCGGVFVRHTHNAVCHCWVQRRLNRSCSNIYILTQIAPLSGDMGQDRPKCSLPTAVGQHGENNHVPAGWGPRFRLHHLCVSTGFMCCACASTMRAGRSADVCCAIQTRTLALHPTCICGLRLCSRGCLCIGAASACVLCGGWVLGAARLWPCA